MGRLPAFVFTLPKELHLSIPCLYQQLQILCTLYQCVIYHFTLLSEWNLSCFQIREWSWSAMKMGRGTFFYDWLRTFSMGISLDNWAARYLFTESTIFYFCHPFQTAKLSRSHFKVKPESQLSYKTNSLIKYLGES